MPTAKRTSEMADLNLLAYASGLSRPDTGTGRMIEAIIRDLAGGRPLPADLATRPICGPAVGLKKENLQDLAKALAAAFGAVAASRIRLHGGMTVEGIQERLERLHGSK